MPRMHPAVPLSSVGAFFVDASKILRSAENVVASFPAADVQAVEGTLYQVEAVRSLLWCVDDGLTTDEELYAFEGDIARLLHTLTDFVQRTHTPGATTSPPKEFSGKRGRPRFILDLDRLVELHDMGVSWQAIAGTVHVTRQTIYNQLREAGHSTARRDHTDIENDELDAIVATLCLEHPFSGSAIIRGLLELQGVFVSIKRVQDSLRQADPLGVMARWSGVLKRRVYKVRGANALWHHDGNEKLRPWGFYVHGCVDGHSRLAIYLACCLDKRAATVLALFMEAVHVWGWPSRMRGDFGTENNGVEGAMKQRWGEAHNAYIRGRSVHNVRIERLWRDVRKDTLESFRQVFLHLEECGMLDIDNIAHQTCLYIIFQPLIQASLDRTREAWNRHRIRTAGNQSPRALWELSREAAVQDGYWYGDPGDDHEAADDPLYGWDGEAGLPEVDNNPIDDADDELLQASPVEANIENAHAILGGDFLVQAGDDGEDTWGITKYCQAVALLTNNIHQ